MRFLLISFNYEISPYPVMPLGVFYIKDYLEKNNIGVDIIDLYLDRDYEPQLRSCLAENEYTAVGVSIRNIDNILYPSTVSYIDEIRDIVGKIKNISRAPVILGGSGYSIFPREMLKYCGADYGIKGEGEQVLLTALKNIRDNALLEKIPNIYTRDSKNRIIQGQGNNPQINKSFSESWPKRDIRLTEPYIKTGGMISIQIKRGCPFKCIYCTYPDIDGKHLRIRTSSSVIEEIGYLKSRFNFDYFYFVDSIFNYPLEETKDFLRCLKRSGIKIRWTGFFNPRFVDEEFLELTRDTGCTEVEFGVESGSDAILESLEKGFNIKHIERAKHLSDSLGIKTMFYLLIGSPAETRRTIDESIGFIQKLSPDAIAVMLGIRVYPNTRLYSYCAEKGLVSERDSLLKPFFFINDDIMAYASEKFSTLAKEDSRWIIPSLKINYYPEKLIHLRKFGSKGPLWSRLKNIKSHKS